MAETVDVTVGVVYVGREIVYLNAGELEAALRKLGHSAAAGVVEGLRLKAKTR